MWWSKSNPASLKERSTKAPNASPRARRSKRNRKNSSVLRVEALERRQLLASDIAHNALIAEDVNADFKISALDLLGVVNHMAAKRREARLAASGDAVARTAEGESTASVDRSYLDVNNDNNVSALDLLQIVNRMRTGEGAGELAQVIMFPVDANGNAIPGQLVGGVMQYNVGIGQQFSVRTQIQDLRANPQGVRSGYLDIAYENADASATSKVTPLTSEFNELTLSNVDGGTFRLQYGTQETGDIQVRRLASGAIDRNNTATNIRTAIAALPQFASGASNVVVTVQTGATANTVRFKIEFLGSFRGVNIPNPIVSQQSGLTGPGGQTPTASIVTSDNPSQDAVFSYAVDYPDTDNPNGPRETVAYDFNLFGVEPSTQGSLRTVAPGVFEIDEIGGVNTDFDIGESFPEIAGDPITIFDVDFVAANSGIVHFSANHFEGTGNSGFFDLGITLVGSLETLASNVIIYPEFRLNVISGIQANNDTFPVAGTFNEDQGPFTLANVTANDLIINGTLVGIVANSLVIDPAFGTATIAAGNQSIIYTPAANFFGQATLTYTVANSLGQTSVGTVTINVTAVNDPPLLLVPQPAPPTIVEDSPTALVLPASTFFAPGPANETGTVRFVTAVADSSQGNASVNANGELVFTPALNYFGPVAVTVTAIDNGGATTPNPVTIQLSVTADNDAPIAATTPFSTSEDVPLTLNVNQLFSPGPANESGQVVTLSNPQLVAGQTGVTVTINQSGQLVITPDADFFGNNITFTVTGTDNGGGATNATTATFTVSVTPVNDPPTAVDDNFVAISILPDATELLVLNNDSAGPANEPKSALVIIGFSNQLNPNNGTITIAPDGKSIFYRPAAGVQVGTDAFTYTIQDGNFTASARVTVDIIPPVKPFALRDNVAITEGSPSVTIDVMANDLINDNAVRSLVSFTQPSQGTVTREENGTPGDLSDDRLVFVPSSPEFFGTVTFEYTVDDDAVGSNPSVGTVSVRVTEINDVPTVAATRTISTTEDATNFQIASNLLLTGATAGPLEDATQALTIQSVRPISGGVQSVNVVGGNVVFTAVPNFVGDAVFEFTAIDNGTTNGLPDFKTATGLVTVTLSPVNDAPVATNKVATTAEDTFVDIPITTILQGNLPGPANAADELANQALTVISPRVISGGGSVSFVGNSLRYSPAADYNGPVVIEYTIQDSEIVATPGFAPLTATGLINLTVTEVNDTPANFAANRAVFAGLPEALNFTAELNATSRGADNENQGPGRQTLVINRIIPGSVVGGTATLNANGTVTFLAPLGSSGVGSFEVETIDNGTTNGAADPKVARGTVTVNIRPFIPSTVAGKVWMDDDRDGTVDFDEAPLSGVQVSLVGTSVAEGGGPITRSIITGADGSYNFTLLPPGTYTVSYVNPIGAIDGALPNSATYTIAVPGGANLVSNFNVFGVDVNYSSVLDNLVEGYYNRNPAARGKGIDAVVKADGSLAFAAVRGGYSNARFVEIVLSNGGRDAILSIVGQDMSVRTAVVPRGKFFITRDTAGNTFVKIVALESELTFFSTTSTNARAIQSSNYLDSVDSYFASLSNA